MVTAIKHSSHSQSFSNCFLHASATITVHAGSAHDASAAELPSPVAWCVCQSQRTGAWRGGVPNTNVMYALTMS